MPKQQVAALSPESFTSFGDLMRYLRERAHLSQRQLSARVGYHYSYISYIEKNLRVPDEATLLGRFIPALELESESEWVKRLRRLASGKPSVPIQPVGADARPVSGGKIILLPASLTSMIGREREVAQLTEILARVETRLVTLVGPPGVGKTRLALHIAGLAGGSYKDGVVFVNLSPIMDVEGVLPALANAFGVQEQRNISVAENIKTTLRSKNMLIVLDNFEQVVDAAPVLIPLLGEALNVKMLITSREALRLRGEQEFPLAPLSTTGNSLLDSPAVQLFIERARAAKPDFQADEKSASLAVEICRRLDGLPLAIELAAARVQALSLSAMIEQLDRRFEWLTRGARDLPVWRQTLWSAINWSYALLTVQERALFSRLSIFHGGWTIEAARTICSDDTLCTASDIFDLLSQLVDKSLVVADTEGERYSFLETLREFAHEKLEESGDLRRIQQSHFDYFLNLAQTTSPHLHQGSDQVRWLALMEQDHNNLRGALNWTTESRDRAATAMEFGQAMHIFWLTRSYISEARRSLNKILALDPTPNEVRANLLRYASDYASAQGDLVNAQKYEEEGYEISRVLKDEDGMYYSLDGIATLAGRQGNYAKAVELLEQVLSYRRRANNLGRLTTTLNNLALASRRLGRLERAQELFTEAIRITEKEANLSSLAHSLVGLAEVYIGKGEHELAIPLQQRSISIRHELGSLNGIAYSLGSLAISMHHLGREELAVQFESGADKIRRELGVAISPATRAENEQFIAQMRSALGDLEFEKLWTKGQAMTLEQVIELGMMSG